jgi:sulfide dehydrogenase [flavocytochrome c] flavoprotein subunit
VIARRGLLGAAGLTLAGCATMGAKPRVVVVGGGFGGATAARYLKLWGGPAVDVVMVERNEGFISCPMSNLVIAGAREPLSIARGYLSLELAGVQRVRGEVVGIDPVARTLQLADRSRLGWDRLVLAPGVDFQLDGTPGLAEALDSGRVVHAWKAGAQTLALREQLQALPDGGVVLISIPKAPYRCPPGPYERACLVASWLRRHKPRAKLLVMDANPEIQSKKALFERAFREHHAGVLTYQPNAELKEVAGDVARFEFEDVRADVMNLIPPQRAGALARDFANMNGRWVGVDWLTMQAQAAPGVHVVGDALFSAPGMPKSAHLANQQAKVAAAAVLALLKGEAPNPAPVVMNTCYSFVTPELAMHVASVHQYDATERTMKAVPGAGGLSVAASAAEAAYALGWAENIWADSLAS